MSMPMPMRPHLAARNRSDPMTIPRLSPSLALRLALLAMAVIAALFVWRSSFLFAFKGDPQRYFVLFDDAMVSLRYARNWVDGFGLVWNQGERVEGYTNPLWTMLMAAMVLLLGPDRAALGVQILGVIILFGCAWQATRLYQTAARMVGLETNGWILAGGLLVGVFYFPLVYWTMMGMETGLVALLTLAACATALRPARPGAYDDDRRDLALAILLILAYLTRPDAPLALVPAVLVRLGQAAAFGRLRLTITTLILPLIAIGLHLAWRQSYYGDWLPNTYHLKMDGHVLAERLMNGLGFIARFGLEAIVLLVLGAIAAWVLRWTVSVALIGPLVLLVIYQIWVGGDAWPYWRMLAPGVPPMAVGVALLLQDWIARRGRPVWTAGVFVLALIVTLNGRFLPEYLGLAPLYQVPENQVNARAGLILHDLLTEDAVIATAWAGHLPYYANRRAIDLLGKTDPHVAALAPDLTQNVGQSGMRWLPGHDKYDLPWSIGRQPPDFVDTFVWGKQDMRDWAAQRYVPVEVKLGPGETMILFLRRDLKNFRAG